MWKPAERVIATAFDTPAVGWRATRVNTLRLWAAQPIDPILLDAFNAGDHIGALRESNKAESLTRVLYPADATPAGQELRLRQEYFFSSASLQDILRRHLQQYPDFTSLPDAVAIQLNDTHPAVSVAELVRLLTDVHGLDFEQAWDISRRTFSYTNHTLLPEALESWPVPLFERLLPRHMQIVYAINAKILIEARRERHATDEAIRNISLIDETGDRRVRMAISPSRLALDQRRIGSPYRADEGNGLRRPSRALSGPHQQQDQRHNAAPVADAVQSGSFRPDPRGDRRRVHGQYRGASGPRRLCRQGGFPGAFAAVKRANKVRLAKLVQANLGIRIDPSAMFDIQIKRIHEYKRQLLNLIEAVALYDQIRSHPELDWVPRVKLFAGKAAPSYHNAKLIIKLANDIARVINNDPAVRGLLKVVFVPNYNVSLAEVMVPAADLSEQISTAGMEASGTGNMKFALNGALTIGTLDGANVEMRDWVGEENIKIFGMTAEEVGKARAEGHNPRAVIENSRELSQALDAIASGVFSPDDRNRFSGLVDGLYNHDWFMVAADFEAYAKASARSTALDHPVRLVFEGGSQHRPDGLVLVRSHDPAICRRDLESRMTVPPGKDPAPAPPGMLPAPEIAAILSGTHSNPFAVLGVHAAGKT